MFRRLALCLAGVAPAAAFHPTARLASLTQSADGEGRVACEKAPGDTYVVAVMFAGRESRMRLSMAYLDDLVAHCQVDEVHLWNYARTEEDLRFMEELPAKPAYQVLQPSWHLSTNESKVYKFREAYEYYRRTGAGESHWVPKWEGAGPENTVIVKLDDDTVYLDVVKFPCFVGYVRAHKEKFLVSANVVNNPIADFYRAQMLPDLLAKFPTLAVYPNTMVDDFTAWGSKWANGSVAFELHRTFTEQMREFGEQPRSQFAKAHGDCLVFAPPLREVPGGQGRLPINFIGVRWEAWDEVSNIVRTVPPSDPNMIDEIALTLFATMFPNHVECIYTPLLVSHLSFSSQLPEAEEALPLYSRVLADLQAKDFSRAARHAACP